MFLLNSLAVIHAVFFQYHKGELRLVPDALRPDLDVLLLAIAQPNIAVSSSASPLRVLLDGIPGSEEVHVVLNALEQK